MVTPEVDMKQLSDTLKEFCEKQELLRFAYIDESGYARAVPLWFVIINDDCYVGTGATSAKSKAVKRDPRVGWVIDGGERSHYKGVSDRGHVEEVTNMNLRQQVYDALSVKYFGSTGHPKFVEIYGQVDDADTVYWRLIAEDRISWEY
jgi:nitroimidazol reductase NimA-like FMN-containing flavoprotein (pyridoxamine 5'-phosphate oxidase superfamily)